MEGSRTAVDRLFMTSNVSASVNGIDIGRGFYYVLIHKMDEIWALQIRCGKDGL